MKTIIGMLLTALSTNCFWYWGIYGIVDGSPQVFVGLASIVGGLAAFIIFVSVVTDEWK